MEINDGFIRVFTHSQLNTKSLTPTWVLDNFICCLYFCMNIIEGTYNQ
jgi:hypothetical protein